MQTVRYRVFINSAVRSVVLLQCLVCYCVTVDVVYNVLQRYCQFGV
jgi:hypothetical protein